MHVIRGEGRGTCFHNLSLCPSDSLLSHSPCNRSVFLSPSLTTAFGLSTHRRKYDSEKNQRKDAESQRIKSRTRRLETRRSFLKQWSFQFALHLGPLTSLRQIIRCHIYEPEH